MNELLIIGESCAPFADLEPSAAVGGPLTVIRCPAAAAAADFLTRRPARILVACLPDVGDQESLFVAARERCPGALRIAVSTTANATVRGAHQVLSATLQPDDAMAVLESADKVARAMQRGDCFPRHHKQGRWKSSTHNIVSWQQVCVKDLSPTNESPPT